MKNFGFDQEKGFVVDAHFDLTMDLLDRRERGQKNVFMDVYNRDFLEGGVHCIFSAIFLHDHFLPEMALRKSLAQISSLQEEIEESRGRLWLCTDTSQIKKAAEEGRLAVVLSFEGVEPLMGDIRLLRVFHALGVRGVGLSWSRRNEASQGSFFHQVETGTEGGLSPFGVELVKSAENMGMFLDVSHLNETGFWDVLNIAKGPVIASHSNCRALCDHPRNLWDQQIKAIAEKNGVIGMNALNLFVASPSSPKPADIRALVSHVVHIAKLVGPDHVGLGFDFDETFLDYSGMGKAIETFDVLKGHRKTPLFAQALKEEGFNEEEIRKILGMNFMRVLEETIG